MENFEKASKDKYRFNTPVGQITVEDLWDIPLVSRKSNISLDNIAKGLNKQINENEEESFVVKSTSKNNILLTKFNIVKKVIEVRLAEAKAVDDRKKNKEKKQRIMSILADKQDESLKGKSEEELTKLLGEL
jgi:hypothetical protein